MAVIWWEGSKFSLLRLTLRREFLKCSGDFAVCCFCFFIRNAFNRQQCGIAIRSQATGSPKDVQPYLWNLCTRPPGANDVKSKVMDCKSPLPGDSLWVLVLLAGSWVGLILEREATGQGDDWAVQGRKASRGNAARRALEDELPSASARSWREKNSCKQMTRVKSLFEFEFLSLQLGSADRIFFFCQIASFHDQLGLCSLPGARKVFPSKS